MSNHNYSQYSNNKKKKNYNKPSVEETVESTEVKMEAVEVAEPVVEAVETVTLPATVTGTVANCSKLNVRTKPAADAEVKTILEVNAKVVIDPARSTSEWLKITTASGVEGFCMRKFINAKL